MYIFLIFCRTQIYSIYENIVNLLSCTSYNKTRRSIKLSCLSLKISTKMLLGLGCINFKVFGLSLLHSFIVEGNNEFLKKSCFILSWGIVYEFRIVYFRLYVVGIMVKRKLSVWFLTSLRKQQGLVYQRLYWRDSSRNSLTVPLIWPIIANKATNFWWKELL